MITCIMDVNRKLSDDEKYLLKKASEMPITFDEDCPELTDEQLKMLKPAGRNGLSKLPDTAGTDTEEALAKQLPQKVRFEDVGYNSNLDVNLYACICPSCDHVIISFDDRNINKAPAELSGDVEACFKACMVHHAYCGENSYCSACGQKLDWGKYPEE